MKNDVSDSNCEFLLNAVLEIESLEECRAFFGDLCTVPELKAMAQRIVVAKLLKDSYVYSEIVRATGASTATISRVKRSLHFGQSGYDKIFERLDKKIHERV